MHTCTTVVIDLVSSENDAHGLNSGFAGPFQHAKCGIPEIRNENAPFSEVWHRGARLISLSSGHPGVYTDGLDLTATGVPLRGTVWISKVSGGAGRRWSRHRDGRMQCMQVRSKDSSP